MFCEQTIINFKTDSPVKESASKLRGFIAKHYRDIPEFHHHSGKNFNYRHPLIQYKIIEGHPFIIGLREGAIFLHLIDKITELNLGTNNYSVIEMLCNTIPVDVGLSVRSITYSFVTPWLALNEENYMKYQKLGDWLSRKGLLEHILVGNIISMSKGLGYTVPPGIRAEIIRMKEIPTSLKGTPMLGFLSTFSVNFEIPDYWGIGKSVSRGFGTVIRQKTDTQMTEGRRDKTKL